MPLREIRLGTARGELAALRGGAPDGPKLLWDFFGDDWTLSRFAGLHNLPAEPQSRTAEQLAPYEGRYEKNVLGPDGETVTTASEITAEGGQLRIRPLSPDGTVADDAASYAVAFYDDDKVVYVRGVPARADFVRGPNGEVAWFRNAARLERKVSSL